MPENDPNVRWGKKKVRLVYQMWQYKHEAFVTIGGNCRGKTILESAHEQYMENLYEKNKGMYTITFHAENGDTLIKDGIAPLDDDDEDEREFMYEFERDMADALVSIEIVEIIPEK